MKVRLVFKTPDVVENAVNEAISDGTTFSEEEIENFPDEFKELAKKWIQYGECVTLEIDTEKKTCVVVERK